MKTVSTEQAAKLAGITRVTLARWLAAGRIRPTVAVPMRNQTLWRWTPGDVRAVQKLVGKARPGPRAKLNRERLRVLVREFSWKKASSPRYRNSPHRYVIFFESNKTKWKWFAGQIRRFGEYRTWRGQRYKYLLLDGECLWIDWPALNKAKADTLD